MVYSRMRPSYEAYLVNDTVPRKSCVVYNDVNLAVSEFSCLLDQLDEVLVIE